MLRKGQGRGLGDVGAGVGGGDAAGLGRGDTGLGRGDTGLGGGQTGLDEHIQNLGKLCRFCGQTLSKRPLTFKVRDYLPLVEKYVSVCNDDDDDVYPTRFCKTCYTGMKSPRNKWAPSMSWVPHRRNKVCEVCCSAKKLSSGGRPVRKKSPGRPKQDHSLQATLNALREKSMVGAKIDEESFKDKFWVAENSQIRCGLCERVLVCPVSTPCDHLFCLSCVEALFLSKCLVHSSCPTCQTHFHCQTLHPAPTYFQHILQKSTVSCKQCNTQIIYENAHQHAQSCTMTAISHHQTTNSTIVELNQLTPMQRESLGTDILREKLRSSSDGATAVFRTKGQPLVTKLMVKPRVSSQDSAPSTKRKRTTALASIREELSDGSGTIQLQHEVDSARRSGTLDAGTSINITDVDLLAARAMLRLSWRSTRKLKSWLKSHSIPSHCEQRVRQREKEIVGDNLEGDHVPLQFHDEDTKQTTISQTPLVKVSSLEEKVMSQLDQYDTMDLLSFEDTGGEIWVKIGGDKGGSSFKLMLQICNVAKPNSILNTNIIMMFDAVDSIFNLELALKGFSAEVDKLATKTWRGRRLRVFHFGDYEYLTKIYGLTGPNGRHCCLYCLASKQDMVKPASERQCQSRTLESLKQHLEQFNCSRSRSAKDHFNVVRQPLLPIPIEQVCPPGLHISLGLFLKHFNSLEKACHQLDLKAIAYLAPKGNPDTSNLSQSMVSMLEQHRLKASLAEKEEERRDLMEQLSCFVLLFPDEAASQPVQLLQESVKEKDLEINDVKTALKKTTKVPEGRGTITSSLDQALQEIHVQRQAYHGKSFVGNHVHKCLQSENIKKLTQTVADTTRKLCPDDDDLIREADKVARTYYNLFSHFGRCHVGMNTAGFLQNEEIDDLERSIKEYLHFFRTHFPDETVPPKMHLLEDHIIPWLRKWGATMGTMGEQGGESLHAQINNIKRDLRGYSNDLELLMRSVKGQWLASNPQTYRLFT
ncbi:uncharacterized protein [Diadema antillarum]|uniref:uncharacterized protein n=1 Tax=Diadema antillarum TaxID=105358 RepID=UPI003A878265